MKQWHMSGVRIVFVFVLSICSAVSKGIETVVPDVGQVFASCSLRTPWLSPGVIHVGY